MFKIIFFKQLNSTNTKAKQILEPNTVIVAEEQLKGKGRFKRNWNSSKGGIYLSITVNIENIKDLPFLTFIASISAQKAIKNIYKINSIIKWPNDLIYNKKKICGILTESVIGKKKLAIVGIGINTNNKIHKLENKAISLNKVLNKKINNKKIINSLLKHFQKYCSILKNKNYPKILSDWKNNSFLGSKIKVKTMNKTYSGIAFDIDKGCFLIIKDKKGKKVKIREGDIYLE
jgi:BirA family biotin operon repressor/biotin-[acetyl-CoA-carboxylase] ligase